MKEEYIFGGVTIIVTLFLGWFSKKHTYISSKKIPLQNLAIGICVALIEYFITKDFNTAIAISGLTAGGMYDLVKNSQILLNDEDDQEDIQDDMESYDIDFVEDDEEEEE